MAFPANRQARTLAAASMREQASKQTRERPHGDAAWVGLIGLIGLERLAPEIYRH
jgi:hypothetical protein